MAEYIKYGTDQAGNRVGLTADGKTEVIQKQQENWMGNLSQRDQSELHMKMNNEGRKRVADLNTQISSGQLTLDDLNEFGRLNRKTGTGSLWDNVLPGTPTLHSSDVNEMQAIQSRLGPAQRPTGSGASSDTDVRLFMGGLPSVKQGGDVNAGIRSDFQRKFDYAVRKRNAMQQHLNENGNLNGFDEQWAELSKQPPARRSSDAKPGGLSAQEQAELDQLRGRFKK